MRDLIFYSSHPSATPLVNSSDGRWPKFDEFNDRHFSREARKILYRGGKPQGHHMARHASQPRDLYNAKLSSNFELPLINLPPMLI